MKIEMSRHVVRGIARIAHRLSSTRRIRLGEIGHRHAVRNLTVLSDDTSPELTKNGRWEDLPGPTLLPFIGNVNYLKDGFTNMHITQLEAARKYGAMYKDKIFGVKSIVLQDPELCEEVYRAEEKWPYRDFSSNVGALVEERKRHGLPKSFAEVNGEEWAELRRKFHKKMMVGGNVKMFYPSFNDLAVDAVELLKTMRDDDSIVNDVRHHVLGRWAVESIGIFVYGFRTGLLGKITTEENSKFYNGISVVLCNACYLSRAKWLKYIYRSKYNAMAEGFIDWFSIGTKHINTVLQHLKNSNGSDEKLDQNIANSLTCYLMFTKEMSVDECNSHAIDMYGAGYDTTSITTAWILYWLGRNFEKQEILHKEVMEKFPNDGIFTDAVLQRMPYLRACIKESARLTPLVFAIPRSFQHDIALNGYVIPANTQIFLSQYIMGRDENLYPNANEFMPERWLRENKSEQAIHPFTTQPFGFGARSCLGRRIAEAEIQIFIAHLVKQLKIKHVGEEQLGEVMFGLSLASECKFAFYDR